MEKTLQEIIIRTAEEMRNFAAEIAQRAKPGDVYCLKGELGAGKTTFAQGFISALQEEKDIVTSPTFNLVQIYKARNFNIYHCDLYRLENEDEFIQLGLDDAFRDAVTLIEWPEIAERFLPRDAKYITIKNSASDQRKILI